MATLGGVSPEGPSLRSCSDSDRHNVSSLEFILLPMLLFLIAVFQAVPRVIIF